MMAKALQYRETQEIERRIKEDDKFRHQWLSRQAKLDFGVQTRPNGVQEEE
jgi:tetrahydromethanopterin S-methyltransferase subunit F